MNNTELNTIIDNKIKNKIEEYIVSLGFLEKKHIKILLKNYKKYKQTLNVLEKNIELMKSGNFEIIKQSVDCNVQRSLEFKSALEIEESLLEMTIKSKNNYINLINTIDKCLDIIKDAEYSDIIKYRLIEHKSVQETIDIMHISLSTYNRYFPKLLEEMQSLYTVFKCN